MQVDRGHRMPLEHPAGDRLYFLLRHRHQVAVHVEPVVIEAPRDSPGLSALLLDRLSLRAPYGDRVAPDGKALMPVRIRTRIDHDDRVLEERERGRILRGGEVIEQLHGGFESRHFVAVHGAVEPDHGRCPRDHRIEFRLRCAAWVRDAVEVGANRVEARDVLGRRDDEDAHRAALVGDADLLDAHAVTARLGDRQQHALLAIVLRVPAPHIVPEDRLGTGDRRAVRTFRVEGEVAVVAERVHRRAQLGRDDRRDQAKRQEREKKTSDHRDRGGQ